MTTPVAQYLGMTEEAAGSTMLARIREYVEHETPSHHPEQLTRLADAIAEDLAALGAVIEVRDAAGLGRNLIVRMKHPANQPEAQPLLLLGHMDTVHPLGTLDTMPFSVSGERASGPGIYDMKSGLALIVESLHWHARRGTQLKRPITVLFSCDEEVGSHSVRALIDELARQSAVVLVPEPCMPDGGVKTGRKGVATYRIDATGRAAHAGIEPGTAVSAITELVHQCVRILDLADHAKGTTINIGTIEGGTATNVVAAEANAGVDVRLAEHAEGGRVHDALMALRPIGEAQVSVTLSESRPPLVRNEAVARAYEQAKRCAAEWGIALGEGSTGGGSDGSLAAATGAAVLDGLGPRGGGAHAVDEHILIDDLPFRLALMCRLIETL